MRVRTFGIIFRQNLKKQKNELGKEERGEGLARMIEVALDDVEEASNELELKKDRIQSLENQVIEMRLKKDKEKNYNVEL